MQVLKSGKQHEPWSCKEICTGQGNEMEGCHAELLVEEGDFFRTYSGVPTASYVTFECPECGILTDLTDQKHFPLRLLQNLPNQDAWEASK